MQLAAYTFPFINSDLEVNVDIIIKDDAVSDHTAIIPTEAGLKANLSHLPSGELNIFNLVALRLITATAPNHIYEAVTTTVSCGGNIFTSKGKTVITGGWKAIDDMFKSSLKDVPQDEEKEDVTLPELSKGQGFDSVSATIKEGATSPPKHLTEDTLLSAMENAGAEDMLTDGRRPDEAERRGIGTPATRAGIIEKLVKSGFVERVKKNLIPTNKGKNLISILPTELTSAKLTADWENRLLEVQRGELLADEFMAEIADFTKTIVTKNSKPNPAFISLFPNTHKKVESLGKCPRCQNDIAEGTKGFYCMNRECEFALWKNSKFWTSKRKPLTAEIVSVLLKNGRVALKNLHSEKTGKTYSATVELDDGGKFVNYKMTFTGKK